MSQILLPMAVPLLGAIALITIAAMKLSKISDHLIRQEAKINLILAKMEIAFPPPPSAAIQAIIRTQRIAAVKAYREETGLGLKQSLEIIDQWRVKQ